MPPAAKPAARSQDLRPLPTRLREQRLISDGVPAVAGVDEAGRGALAGPVVAAAVILAPERCPEGLDDSKRLQPHIRQALFQQILDAADAVAVYAVSHRRIDAINILRASHEAMCGALQSLNKAPAVALVDGLKVPGLRCEHEPIVGGDGLECCIAAASIIAKVTRDNLMRAYAPHYPDYGFERHKGYGTSAHRDIIMRRGLCPLHRRSFTRFLNPAPQALL